LKFKTIFKYQSMANHWSAHNLPTNKHKHSELMTQSQSVWQKQESEISIEFWSKHSFFFSSSFCWTNTNQVIVTIMKTSRNVNFYLQKTTSVSRRWNFKQFSNTGPRWTTYEHITLPTNKHTHSEKYSPIKNFIYLTTKENFFTIPNTVNFPLQ
jgi:hypothetical protein